MDLMITCQCGAHFRAERKHLGATTNCPTCGSQIEIEALESNSGTSGEPPPPLPLPVHCEESEEAGIPGAANGEGSRLPNLTICLLCVTALVVIGLAFVRIWPEIARDEVSPDPLLLKSDAPEANKPVSKTEEEVKSPASEDDVPTESNAEKVTSSTMANEDSRVTAIGIQSRQEKADPLAEAQTAMEAKDFGRVLEILGQADEELQATEEAKELIKTAEVAKHIEKGQKLMAAGNASKAIAEFSAALRLEPAGGPAATLLGQAKQSAGYHSAPFVASFSDVPDGQLPVGWESGNSVVVKHRGGSSWIESSAQGEHVLTTPPLAFPEDFELHVASWLDDRARVRIALLDDREAVRREVAVNCKWGNIEAGFDDVQTMKPGLANGTVRIRLVRDGRILRLFIRDQETTRPGNQH